MNKTEQAIQDIADKAIAKIKAVRDADLVQEDFSPEIGDWLEFSYHIDFSEPFLGKVAYYNPKDAYPYHKENRDSSKTCYSYARRPISHTDILIKVDNGVMPEWIRDKDVTVFYLNGPAVRSKLTDSAWTSFIGSFIVHSEKAE